MSASQDWDGYTPRTVTKDAKPVSPEFGHLWPPNTPGIDAGRPGHEARPKTTVVYDDKTPPGQEEEAEGEACPWRWQVTRYRVTAESVLARSPSTVGELVRPWMSDSRARVARGVLLPRDVPRADLAYLLAKRRIEPVAGRAAQENDPG